MSRKTRSFVVRMRSTVIEHYTVDAYDEADARERADRGEAEFSQELERPDWEVESVEENK